MPRFWWVWLLGGILAPSAALTGYGQNTLRWTTNYYVITGATLVEIHQSLRDNRPWKDRASLDGLTQWQIDWRFKVVPSNNGCECTEFSTQTTIITTLPRWRPPSNASEPVKKEWERYFKALGQHEAGHARFPIAADAELHRKVKAIGAQADCAALRRKIEETGQQVLTEYRRRERDYDKSTQHGVTEGAVLPLYLPKEADHPSSKPANAPATF